MGVAKFPFLIYLSLANNDISSIASLSNMKYLEELRLQGNRISDVRPLKKMINLKALYLGHNQIYQNIDFLDYLSELRVLYLNDNQITDISSLVSLTKLAAINVSNNQLVSLATLEAYSDTLEEVYAENNNIARFDFVENMTGLRKLMLAGNDPVAEDYLSTYLSGLTNLETLTLSDKPLTDLSFLNGMSKLIRLEVANCGLPSYSVNAYAVITNEDTGEQSLQITDYVDNIAAVLSCKSTLKLLDISRNNMRYYQDEMLAYMEANGLPSGLKGISFKEGNPLSFGNLSNLGKLVLLYSDNVNKAIDAGVFTALMTELQYISMEDCGITGTAWLSRFPKIVFIDLANNPIRSIDLGANISARGRTSLRYLFLDTTASNCSFASAYRSFDENRLLKLSLRNVKIPNMYYLPYMEELKYLDLTNTGITNLQGTEPDFYDIQTIERYGELETLFVSKLDADITVLTNMNSLKKVYAIAEPSDTLFYEANIHALYALHNRGVTCYLYDEQTEYLPLTEVEGANILGEIEDISCTVRVAADNRISDNNPYLVTEVNDFDIAWSVSNNDNYKIVDNRLAVKSYENIDNETLTLSACITVYPGGSTVTRDFSINTDILRASEPYIASTELNIGEEVNRDDSFTYHHVYKAAAAEGFSVDVKPVADEPWYEYCSSVTPYTNVLHETDEDNHVYSIDPYAEFGTTVEVKVFFGHTVNGEFTADAQKSTGTMTIAASTQKVTFMGNGGTISLNSDGSNITDSERTFAEGSDFIGAVTAERKGYLFNRWTLDAAGNEPNPYTVMPRENLILYAQWTPHSFTVTFDPAGGTVSTTYATMLCDEAFGLLPVPTKDYYHFLGWFTALEGGTVVDEGTVMTTSENITVYAHWELNPLSDWVLASTVPSDARIEENKWTYTLTTRTESTDTSLSGYTQEGSYWIESQSGSFNYASFPGGFLNTHAIYREMNRAAYTANETETTKRTVTTARAGYIFWHWMYDCGQSSAGNRAIYNRIGTPTESGSTNFYYKYFGAFTSTNGYARYGNNSYCNNIGWDVYYETGRTSYADSQGSKYWFRMDYYNCSYTDFYKMFRYYKVEQMESMTAVEESDSVSDVQHWALYRNK